MSYFVMYQGAVNHTGAKNLEALVTGAIEKGVKELTICICSGGGDVTSGIGLYNFLKMVPAKINTHNFGACGSIAATIFLAGERRTTAAASMFTLHAATFVEGPRKGEISENTTMIYEPFKLALGWQDDKINAYFSSGAESFIQPAQAKEFGIVHDITDLKMPEGAVIVPVHVP